MKIGHCHQHSLNRSLHSPHCRKRKITQIVQMSNLRISLFISICQFNLNDLCHTYQLSLALSQLNSHITLYLRVAVHDVSCQQPLEWYVMHMALFSSNWIVGPPISLQGVPSSNTSCEPPVSFFIIPTHPEVARMKQKNSIDKIDGFRFYNVLLQSCLMSARSSELLGMASQDLSALHSVCASLQLKLPIILQAFLVFDEARVQPGGMSQVNITSAICFSNKLFNTMTTQGKKAKNFSPDDSQASITFCELLDAGTIMLDADSWHIDDSKQKAKQLADLAH